MTMIEIQEGRLELKYVGVRFNEARLPVDVLPDLTAFRDLLASTAKGIWLREHPNRRRVPKFFNESLSFDLVDVREGSAIPQIEWNRSRAIQLAPELIDEMEEIVPQAYREIASLFEEARSDLFPPALSSERIAALNRFGSGLRDDERIEFVGQNGRDGNVIYLDSYLRRRLLTKVGDTYSKRYESSGKLVASSLEGWIAVETGEHGKIVLPLPVDVIQVHYDGSLGGEVHFDLMIELDSDDRLRSILDVFDVAIVDSNDSGLFREAMMRISELRRLKAGWLDGEGVEIAQAAIRTARWVLDQRPALANELAIFPTVSGGVTFEFIAAGWDYSLEFLHSGHVEVYGVELRGSRNLDPVDFPGQSNELLALLDERLTNGRDCE